VKAKRPFIRFPIAFKVGPSVVDPQPTTTSFYLGFQVGETFKRHTDRKIDVRQMHLHQTFLVEKGAVDSRFDLRLRQRVANFRHTVQDEIQRTVRVMDIAATVIQIEELASLSHRTKQWVITAGSLLLLVETNRCAFGVTPRRKYGTIEVQRDTGQFFGQEPIQDPLITFLQLTGILMRRNSLSFRR